MGLQHSLTLCSAGAARKSCASVSSVRNPSPLDALIATDSRLPSVACPSRKAGGPAPDIHRHLRCCSLDGRWGQEDSDWNSRISMERTPVLLERSGRMRLEPCRIRRRIVGGSTCSLRKFLATWSRSSERQSTESCCGLGLTMLRSVTTDSFGQLVVKAQRCEGWTGDHQVQNCDIWAEFTYGRKSGTKVQGVLVLLFPELNLSGYR